MSEERVWTAALLVIGDEILSGRTEDKNIAQVARWLNHQGIRLREVRVVPDIEDEAVVRRIEDAVDCNGQLDHAEAGAKMSAGARYRIDHLIADFAGELRQFPVLQLSQVGRILDPVQQGRLWHLCQG